MIWMRDSLWTKGVTWPLFAALLAGQLTLGQDFCDDFVGNPIDGIPVRYTSPCWGPWQCTPTPEGLDCVRQPPPFAWGFFIADTDEPFTGDIVVQARVSPRGVDRGFSISAHASFDCPVLTGYEGVVKRNGDLELRRWDEPGPQPVLTDVGSIDPPVDLLDPDLQLEMELRIHGGDVEFRVSDGEKDRPDTPQVIFENEWTHRSGRSSVAFGNLPADASSFRIYSFCVSELVPFTRGNANADKNVNLTDAVATLNYLFLGDDPPACADAADVDDSGTLDITDAVRTLGWLFLGDEAPPAPGPTACGVDPTADRLGCERQPEDCQ